MLQRQLSQESTEDIVGSGNHRCIPVYVQCTLWISPVNTFCVALSKEGFMCFQITEPRLSGNLLNVWNLPFVLDTFHSIQESSRLSWNSPSCWETLQAVYKFPECPEIFKIVWNIFQTVQKYFTLPRNLPDCREIFKTVQKSSRLSENFPAHFPVCKAGIVQTAWKSSTLSKKKKKKKNKKLEVFFSEIIYE